MTKMISADELLAMAAFMRAHVEGLRNVEGPFTEEVKLGNREWSAFNECASWLEDLAEDGSFEKWDSYNH